MQHDVLESLRDDYRINEERLHCVLEMWLSNANGLPNHERYPLSWQGLHNLLSDCDRIEVAKLYFEFLCKMSS